MVVEQIPAKLAPDVVKNTNLKIAHRIVAGDDRSVLAAAMAMNDRQEMSLARLGVGRAAVFADGEDAPLLVDIPRQKGGPGQVWPGPQRLRDQMRRMSVAAVQPELLYPGPDCDEGCAALPSACAFARDLSEDSDVRRTVARVLLSAMYDSGALGRIAPELMLQVDARRPRWVDRRDALDRLTLHAARHTAAGLGALSGWSYADTGDFSDGARAVLAAAVVGLDGAEAVEGLRGVVRRVQGSGFGPFVGCTRIWAGEHDPCLCRHVVADIVATGQFTEAWHEARAASAEERDSATWDVCQDAAYHAIEFPTDEATGDDAISARARRVSLCFGQQMLATLPWSHPRSQSRVFAQLAHAAGLP